MQEFKRARMRELLFNVAAGHEYNAATPHRNIRMHLSYRYNAVIPHGVFHKKPYHIYNQQITNYKLEVTNYQLPLLKICPTLSAVANPDSGFLRARKDFTLPCEQV